MLLFNVSAFLLHCIEPDSRLTGNREVDGIGYRGGRFQGKKQIQERIELGECTIWSGSVR